VDTQGGTVRVVLGERVVELNITRQDSQEGWCRTTDGNTHRFFWAWSGNALQLWVDGDFFIFERAEVSSRTAQGSSARGSSARGPSGPGFGPSGGGDIVAPMPGTVEQILVRPGDIVERGQTLIIMESMKMELEIAAPRAGVVKRIAVIQGGQVEKGMHLLELDDVEEPA
jgi:biotin carboxyl carrier protein